MNKSGLINLTWEDLNNWAGERVVARGKSYMKNVQDLRITPEGALISSVRGSKLYSTHTGIDAKGEFFSQCNCPYSWGHCKHAVASILVYLDACKKKENIALAEHDDERILELSEKVYDPAHFVNEELDEKKNDMVSSHLNNLSKKELIDLLLKGENIIPELSRKLKDADELQKGDIGKLVDSIRREIKTISSEPAWTNHWNGEGETPDYSPIKKRLEMLLSTNHENAVVELGKYLMERGIEQINQSNDEGETVMEIASCMEVVFKAIIQSNLSMTEKLLLNIDLSLLDDYGILDDIKGPLDICKASSSDWSKVADSLSERINGSLKQQRGREGDYSSKYHRERVMHWLLHALSGANRKREIIGILERETIHTDCYVELVKRLLQDKQIKRASEWALRGIRATSEKAPGIASCLEEMLREIALKEQNYLLAAAYAAYEFFNRPGIDKYSQLEKIASKATVWESVKSQIMLYLEKGAHPRGSTWPLPRLEFQVQKRISNRFPDTDTLIDIAIKEKRHEDALRWYNLSKKSGGFGRDYTGDKIAQTIETSFPSEAIAIWKELAANEIAVAKPAAYQIAGKYIQKIKRVYSRLNKPCEWTEYLSKLRESNMRRPRMVDVLNKLEGRQRRIVE